MSVEEKRIKFRFLERILDKDFTCWIAECGLTAGLITYVLHAHKFWVMASWIPIFGFCAAMASIAGAYFKVKMREVEITAKPSEKKE